MSKFLVKSISEIHTEQQEQKKRLEKGFKQEDIKLTKDELKQMLDVIIEDKCKYKLMGFYPEVESGGVVEDVAYPGVPESTQSEPPTEKDINEITETVYKRIVSDFRYDSNLVIATRAVKFNEDYVKGIIKECNKKLAKKAKDIAVGKSEKVSNGLFVDKV